MYLSVVQVAIFSLISLEWIGRFRTSSNYRDTWGKGRGGANLFGSKFAKLKWRNVFNIDAISAKLINTSFFFFF